VFCLRSLFFHAMHHAFAREPDGQTMWTKQGIEMERQIERLHPDDKYTLNKGAIELSWPSKGDKLPLACLQSLRSLLGHRRKRAVAKSHTSTWRLATLWYVKALAITQRRGAHESVSVIHEYLFLGPNCSICKRVEPKTNNSSCILHLR